jgi:hypothetical protein
VLQYGPTPSFFNTPEWAPQRPVPPPGRVNQSLSATEESFNSQASGLIPLHQAMPILLGQEQ